MNPLIGMNLYPLNTIPSFSSIGQTSENANDKEAPKVNAKVSAKVNTKVNTNEANEGVDELKDATNFDLMTLVDALEPERENFRKEHAEDNVVDWIIVIMFIVIETIIMLATYIYQSSSYGVLNAVRQVRGTSTSNMFPQRVRGSTR